MQLPEAPAQGLVLIRRHRLIAEEQDAVFRQRRFQRPDRLIIQRR